MVRLKNLSWTDKSKLKIQINHDDQVYHIDLKKGHDLSIKKGFFLEMRQYSMELNNLKYFHSILEILLVI